MPSKLEWYSAPTTKAVAELCVSFRGTPKNRVLLLLVLGIKVPHAIFILNVEEGRSEASTFTKEKDWMKKVWIWSKMRMMGNLDIEYIIVNQNTHVLLYYIRRLPTTTAPFATATKYLLRTSKS